MLQNLRSEYLRMYINKNIFTYKINVANLKIKKIKQ